MADVIPDSATVVVAEDVLSSTFENELIILDLRNGVYYGLEETGVEIWELLGRPTSIAEIRDAILATYDVDPDRLERDIRELLEDLAAKGLVDIHVSR